MPRRVVLAAGVLVLLALALSFTPHSVFRAAAGILAFTFAPGVAVLAWVFATRPSTAKTDHVLVTALVLAIAPLVSAAVMTILFFLGLPLAIAARAFAVLLAAALGWAWLRGKNALASGANDTSTGEDLVGAPRSTTAALVAVLLVLVTLWPLFTSARVRTSIHGLLHTSLLYTVVERGVPPENPFFADKPVRYYWSWHAGTAATCAVADVTPVTAFSLANVAALLSFLLLLGALAFELAPVPGSAPLGVLLGYFGLNPIGALAFLSSHHKGCFEDVAHGADPLQVTQYLRLPIGEGDNRISATLTKFLNVSSFPAAFALTVGIWWLVPRIAARSSVAGFVLGMVVMGGAIALSPITGLAAGGALGAAAALCALLSWRKPDERRGAIRVAAMLLASLVIAIPFALLGGGDSEGNVTAAPSRTKAVQSLETLGPMLLVGLPLLWARLKRGALGARLLVLSIPVLLVSGWAVGFAVNSEYKLVRIAAPLLGVFAAGSLALGCRPQSRWRGARIALAALVVAACIPTNAIAWWAYVRHSEVVLHSHGNGMDEVLDADQPLGEMYAWIRANTPEDAIVIVDPSRPVRNFAGPEHGDEVPALAHRPVFTDKLSYMNDYEESAGVRLQLVQRLFAGDAMQAQDRAQLQRLSRPTYVLIHPRAATEFSRIVTSMERAKLFEFVHKAGGAMLFKVK